MTMPSGNIAAARTALREAARALTVATSSRSAAPGIADSVARGLAADLAHTLEAVATVMREVSHEPVPTSAASHNLQALVHHVRDGAAMARHISGTDGQAPRTLTSSAALPAATPDD
jgi:hypothetical protein